MGANGIDLVTSNDEVDARGDNLLEITVVQVN